MEPKVIGLLGLVLNVGHKIMLQEIILPQIRRPLWLRIKEFVVGIVVVPPLCRIPEGHI